MALTLSKLEEDGWTWQDAGRDIGSVGSLDLDLKVKVCGTVQAKTKFPHSVRDVVPGN